MDKNDKILFKQLMEELVVNGDLKTALADLHSIAISQEKIATKLTSLLAFEILSASCKEISPTDLDQILDKISILQDNQERIVSIHELLSSCNWTKFFEKFKDYDLEDMLLCKPEP